MTAGSGVDPEVSAAARLRWIVRNSRRWILALVLLVVALAVASFSFGLFTSSSANPSNTFSSGSMSQVNSSDDKAAMSATGMVPGDRTTGQVSITNVGDATGTFALSGEDLVDTPGPNGGNLSDALMLRIVESDREEPLYSGPLAGFDTVPLGDWAPDEERTYDFRVTFPSGAADDRFQRSVASVTFTWDAVQTTS